ncbi:hypothetical protein GE09DRAFT_341325 [Coniochaeta sp. 2T2.1]|nr:hypothetical protein GE09DRAFT_341325 [Coniochaeta sp. 2T2.1]
MNLRQSPPFLAYLSACETDRIRDERFVDESIHLISAWSVGGLSPRHWHFVGTVQPS